LFISYFMYRDPSLKNMSSHHAAFWSDSPSTDERGAGPNPGTCHLPSGLLQLAVDPGGLSCGILFFVLVCF
ncbi:hypothetical protein, partial [Escherichia coli]|uniref:hypothetical protein n=1 Tax=Escherichia coli TaxID=562 RepID=UPI001F3AA782